MVRRNREASSRRGRGRNKGRMINLADVETFVAFPEGKFCLKVKEIEEGEGDAGDYWKWSFEDADPKGVEGTVTHITSFAKQALFNLKSLLESLGVEIPDNEFDLDEMKDDFIGMEMMAETSQEDVETDNGRRTYTRIVDHWPVEEEDDKPGKRAGKKGKDEEEDDRPARRGKKEKKADLTEDDVNEMSQDDLETVIEEHKLDIDLGDFKTVSKMRAAVIDALKEAGVLEGEAEEEEEEKPARSSRSSRRSAKKDEEEEAEEEDDRPSRRSSRRRR